MPLAYASVDVDGPRVHSYAGGPLDGLPDVLLHGWATAMQEAPGDLRCCGLDLPGNGRSHKPHKEWHSIPEFDRVLAGFCERMAAMPPSIVPPKEGMQTAGLLPEAAPVRPACGHHPHDEASHAPQGALKESLRQFA